MNRHPRTDILEDVEFLTSAGESAAGIAARLGLKPGSVARALYRCNRPELAAQFETARRVVEGKDCVDCGTRISCRKATRCRRCGCLERERVKREQGWAA